MPVRPIIYLANAYTHPDPAVMDERFRIACKFAVAAIEQGFVIYSPIAATVALQRFGGARGDWSYWSAYDTEFVLRCDELWVLVYQGWQESVGVQAEIDIATKAGKIVRMIDPEDYGIDLSRHDGLLNVKAAA